MSRFNVFFLVHKGLRAMMYDLSIELQHTDFAVATIYPQSLERLEEVLEILDAHGGHEDMHIFNLLQACNPALQTEMEQEHVTDIALGNELRLLMEKYKAATEAPEKNAIGNMICYTYYEYVAYNLKHLNKEELNVNECLWGNYTDAEIIESNMRMIANMAPGEVKRNAVWMMRGCSNGDLTGWLATLKKQVPEPVFNLLMGIAEAELPAHRLAAIQEGILEMA